MESVLKTSKNVDTAILEALKELNTTIENVKIDIIQKEKKGFLFGIASKPAKVLVVLIKTPEQTANEFITKTFKLMNIPAKIITTKKDKYIYIDISSEKASLIIGKHGQTLESLENIINLIVNKETSKYTKVVLDIENYKQKRIDTLKALAFNVAKKVNETKVKAQLEPMTSHERRIIHSALEKNNKVTTKSKGKEPNRCVVIVPKAI
jgi:spoIIIJ-associated protein